MSFGNAISVALLLGLYVAEITGAIWSDAEQAVLSFADVAHQRRFELEIRSSSTEWYREGMQLFAFIKSGCYWEKKHITWTVYNHTKSIPRARVLQIIGDAFAKWAAVTTKTFQHVDYTQRPDIFIEFSHTEEHTKDRRIVCGIPILPRRIGKMDDNGAAIIIDHRADWSDTTSSSQILGLGNTECTGAILYPSYSAVRPKSDPKLHEDDILGIQALYGAPPGWPARSSGRMNPVSAPRPGGPTSTFGRMNPASAPRPGGPTPTFGRTNPVSAPRSSSSSSDDDTTETTSSGGSSDDDDSSDDSN